MYGAAGGGAVLGAQVEILTRLLSVKVSTCIEAAFC